MAVKIYIDTNVFVDFYQAANDRTEIFSELEKYHSSIVLVQQTLDEFQRNRAERLTNLIELVDKAKFGVHTTSVIREMPQHAELCTIAERAEILKRQICDELEKYRDKDDADPVFKKFQALTKACKVLPTMPDIIEKAARRNQLGRPPRSDKKGTIGDEVIWETLLACCDDDLVIVSRDGTFNQNQQYLRAEYAHGRSRKLLLVTSRVGDGLKAAGTPSPTIEKADESVATSVVASQYPVYTFPVSQFVFSGNRRCPFCDGETEPFGVQIVSEGVPWPQARRCTRCWRTS